MGGSMGSVVGEKFARACDRAADEHGVLVSVSASGGARMQEGILALMQLPKTVAAVDELHDAGGTLISVLAHPTTGGVLASFASLGDVMLAEPGALMSFAGPRVVAQTTREKLPGRLRARRVELPLRPRRRGRAATRAAPDASRGSSASSGGRRDAGSRARPPRPARAALRRQAPPRHAPLGRARAAAAPARAPPRGHDRRGDLEARRARAARGAAVHARLRRADPRRLVRAARRPRPHGRLRDRGGHRPAERPDDRARRAPEGPRPQGARRPELRHGLSRGVPQGDAHDGARRAPRLPARDARRHARRLSRASPPSSTARAARSRAPRR